MKSRNRLFTLTLLLPWLITFCVFWLYPLLYAGYLSFTDYSTLSNTAEFVGLKNYQAIFQDEVFYKALTNTVIFTFGTVPITTALAIFFAVLLNSKLARFQNYFRATFFIPAVTSLVVISLIFSNLYTQDGYINSILSSLNFPYPERGWLQDTRTSLLSIMAMDVWGAVGYYMILFLAGMQAISQDLYSAADIAGASAWQKFRRITLPLLKPTLVFVVFINSIKSFQVFIEIMIMTKGGPMNSTMSLVYMVYSNAFEKSDAMGYASAMAYVVFAILLVFTYIQHKFLKTD